MSWFPNLVGTEQKRFFDFAGDRLTLKTPRMTLMGEDQVHCLVWQRLRQCSLEHDPEKWLPVFGKGHAPSIT